MLAAGKVPTPPPFSSLALYFLQAELFHKTWCLVVLSFLGETFHLCGSLGQRCLHKDLLNYGAGSAISATFFICCSLIIDVSS